MNATSFDSPRSGEFWRQGLLLFLAVVLLSLPQTALVPLLDRDEPRFAEASREMMQSGDLIVPTFNHEPRYNKPPLIYWCQCLSFFLFGENAFAARLPSVLATAGTTLLLAMWGLRLGSAQMGLGTALSYAFCLQAIQQGRVATADALLIFFMTLTVFAGWHLLTLARNVSNRHSWNRWGAILALGFAGGFLAKGPEALLPILPLLYCARRMGARVLASFVAMLLLGLLLVAGWGVPALIETHGEFWHQGMSEGVVQRIITGLQGHGASTLGWYLLSIPFYYFLLFWVSALPWSPLLLISRKKLFASWKPDPLDSYLLLNAGLIFLVFSLMVTKLPHYTLPAFPLLALIFAKRWKSVGFSPGTLTELGWVFIFFITVTTAVFVPVALANHLSPSPVGELVREAGDAIKPDTQFALVDFQEPTAIWEMRRVTKAYGQSISKSDVSAFLNQPGPRAVVLTTARWAAVSEHADASWKIYQTRGINSAKGAFIDLTLVVKP